MKSETMKLCRVGALAGLTALLVACGDDVTNTTNNVTGAKTVADLAAAGTCDESAQGEIVLNEDDGALYVCYGGNWISMKGEGGESGCDLNSIEVDGVEGVEIVCGNAKDTVLNGKKGDKGGSGAPGDSGTSCVGNKFAEGLQIVCGGVALDTLTDGAVGSQCTAEKIAEGVVVSCDGAVVDTIRNGASGDGCTGRKIDGGVEISCGGVIVDTLRSASSVRFCGDVAYDATTKLCDTRDSSLYDLVRIGNQTWMKQNLNFDYKIYGVSYGSRCYNDEPDSCAKYGRLYTWAAAMDSATTGCGYRRLCDASGSRPQGVCPDGFHLPDTVEWSTLVAAVAEDPDTACAALRTVTGWVTTISGHVPGTNSSGFSALPSGAWNDYSGIYNQADTTAMFWTPDATTNNTTANVWYLRGTAATGKSSQTKLNALAVRCLKNED